MSIDHNKLKANREGNQREGRGGWRTKDGPNQVRILPPGSQFLDNWDAMDHLAFKYEVHFFNIEGRKATEVSRCLSDLKQRCPACAISRAFKDSEDPGLKEMAKKIRATSQYLFNIIDLDNIQGGIQQWAANYTCWDKIIEVAANPSWGNIVDPEDGVDFTVTKTPGNRNRTGRNQYSAVPNPERTNVMGILDTIEEWQSKLDGLEALVSPAKEPSELVTFMEEMGFPTADLVSRTGIQPNATSAPAPVATPVAARPAAVRPAAVATPAPVAAARPVAAAKPAPAAVRPAPAAAKPAAVAARPRAVAAPAAVEIPEGVHYDPGPDYVPAVVDEDRPEGVPRCYGDYDPKIHQCRKCPVLAECQMRMVTGSDE